MSNYHVYEREDIWRTVAQGWWASLSPAQRIAFRKWIWREVHSRRHA